MDIFVPASLTHADIVLSLATSFEKLLDPKERAKIADDIKAHHALNTIEAKKADDAKSLIKQHTAILDETKKISEQNKKDAEELHQKQITFDEASKAEMSKIKAERDDVEQSTKDAKTLHDKATSMINDVANRESDLKKDKETHKSKVNKQAEDQKSLDNKLEEVEEIKKQQTVILDEIKAKKAAVAAFNI